MQISASTPRYIRNYQANQGSQEVAKTQPVDSFTPMQIGLEAPSADKEAVIKALLRTSPNDGATARVIEALSAYPLQALKDVQNYGTRIEVYADGSKQPSYMPTLGEENVLGAYNTRANVLGVFNASLSPFALIHEFGHALDAALGDQSNGPDWKNARTTAQYTQQAVRTYATYDEGEYMAENTVAYLVADQQLPDLIARGYDSHVGVGNMDEREYWQMHQNYSHDRLQHLDPAAFQLVDDTMTHKIFEGPFQPARPAMNEEEWNADVKSAP